MQINVYRNSFSKELYSQCLNKVVCKDLSVFESVVIVYVSINGTLYLCIFKVAFEFGFSRMTISKAYFIILGII